MTLKRLELHNYMIHRDMCADFSGNMIALTGEMGHGKSTFVGAIQFCLTGEHPPWNRADLLSWGQEEGSAKLYFSHEGKDCEILRKLHKSEATLKIGDDTITGISNVEKTMVERMGVDKDILKQIGFVQQYEIQAILFDDPGKREKSFQKLLGIGDANKIWTDLGPIMQSYARSENFDASIESMKQILDRLEKELDYVERNLETSRKAMDLIPSPDEMRKESGRLSKIQTTLRMLSDSRKTSADISARMLSESGTYSKLLASKKSILDRLGCTTEEMDRFVEGLKTAYNVARTALQNMRKLAWASDSDGLCPLCGSSVSEGQISGHVSSELSRLEEEEEESRKGYESAASTYRAVKEELSRIDSEIQGMEHRNATNAALLDSEKNREKQILSGLGELGVSPESSDMDKLMAETESMLREFDSAYGKYNELNTAISTLQGEKNAKVHQIEQTRKMLEDKEKEKELNGPIAEKIEILGRVRDWFHCSNGPRTMSTSAIRAMTGYVNEYLKALHSEIMVHPDSQSMGFSFSYLDGRTVSDPLPSTAKLSGGQKIELALAFRLAIYRYFGQKMGIMVLDEPTAHLSPAGIRYFGELLQTVSTLARNMNLQIIMPTHEKEIMPYMDSEIHFS